MSLIKKLKKLVTRERKREARPPGRVRRPLVRLPRRGDEMPPDQSWRMGERPNAAQE